MSALRSTPRDIARRLGARKRAPAGVSTDGWKRETFRLPRPDARAKAREWFDLYPKAAYMTEIEFWEELADDHIAFTIRRLRSAD